jgi:hypothetical protein
VGDAVQDHELNAESMLARAREATGLSDFADISLADRLGALVRQIQGRLDVHGRAQAEATIQGLLEQRLEFFDARRHYPIADERIERPVIAFGEARSGTTVLQMLLGCDDDARLLEFWEAMRPCPPPGASGSSNQREKGDADWREILDLIPRWLCSHPYNAMLGRNPPECERLWAIDFRSMPPTAWWRVPVVPLASPRISLPHDHKRQYEIHRMMLQHLQFGRPARRWVLKGVTHQQRIAALLDAYPDAIFVWIHRDPVQAIASRFELHAQIYEGIAGTINRPDFARTTVEICVANFQAAATEPLATDPRIHHLLYGEFRTNPVGSVHDLYERVGLPFSANFESAMRAWLADNPSGRYGKFEYSVDALGVDTRELGRLVEPYRERFHIPHETARS